MFRDQKNTEVHCNTNTTQCNTNTRGPACACSVIRRIQKCIAIQIQLQYNTNTRGPARACFAIRSALQYKYNTIQYKYTGPPRACSTIRRIQSALPAAAAAAKKVTQRPRVHFVQMQIQSQMGNTNSKSDGK